MRLAPLLCQSNRLWDMVFQNISKKLELCWLHPFYIKLVVETVLEHVIRISRINPKHGFVALEHIHDLLSLLLVLILLPLG